MLAVIKILFELYYHPTKQSHKELTVLKIVSQSSKTSMCVSSMCQFKQALRYLLSELKNDNHFERGKDTTDYPTSSSLKTDFKKRKEKNSASENKY